MLPAILQRIVAGRPRYEAVSRATGVPWAVVAALHEMEAGGSFRCHLHNGDPLTARTVQVPKGRPVAGRPPFAWVDSAVDALRYDGLDTVNWRDLEAALDALERYNGLGYRRRRVPSPYLWSGSQHYVKGKFVRDGKFDPEAVSRQVGAAVILKACRGRGWF